MTSSIISLWIQRWCPGNGYISFEWVPVTGSKVQRNIVISHPDGGSRSIRTDESWTDNGRSKARVNGHGFQSLLSFQQTRIGWTNICKRCGSRQRAGQSRWRPFVQGSGEWRFQFPTRQSCPELGIEPLDVSKMGCLDALCSTVMEVALCPRTFTLSSAGTPRHAISCSETRTGCCVPEQVRFIAEQTDFLCIEKSHGMGELGAAELGAKHEAAAFKKIQARHEGAVLLQRRLCLALHLVQ